ncbi:hypothetical protein [Joostella sp. CR20]|uniref:hypothetical protein n=1 Tax=Joostella sp. CR20 TaxID=2804312 RepID=UPI00313DE21A
MKNLKIFLAVASMFVSTMLVANNDPKPVNKNVTKELSTILGTPSFRVSEDDMIANVHFLVNSKNELVVINVVAENDMVESYIKSRMNYKKVTPGTLKANEEYKVDVRIVAKG